MQALLDAIAAMPLPTDAQRIFHGRGGLYPGCEAWTLDVFPPVFVLISFAPATEAQRAGRQIAPMLRLMSSDLVLDEPDEFDIGDLPAGSTTA